MPLADRIRPRRPVACAHGRQQPLRCPARALTARPQPRHPRPPAPAAPHPHGSRVVRSAYRNRPWKGNQSLRPSSSTASCRHLASARQPAGAYGLRQQPLPAGRHHRLPRVCAPSFRMAERRYAFTVSVRTPSRTAASAFVAPVATAARTSSSRGASTTRGGPPAAGRAAAASRPQAASSSARRAGSVMRGASARSSPCADRTASQAPAGPGGPDGQPAAREPAAREAAVLGRTRIHRPTRRRRPPRRRRTQPPRLVPHHQRLLQVPGRRHRGVQHPVAQRLRPPQRPVQHRPHPAPHHHRHGEHRPQALRRHRRVVLVADVPRLRVVRHRARPGQRDRPAAQAAAGAGSPARAAPPTTYRSAPRCAAGPGPVRRRPAAPEGHRQPPWPGASAAGRPAAPPPRPTAPRPARPLRTGPPRPPLPAPAPRTPSSATPAPGAPPRPGVVRSASLIARWREHVPQRARTRRTQMSERGTTARFRATRDFLLRHREDYDAAYRGFSWPRFAHFNWAEDWFDALAAGNGATALHLVEEDGRETRVSFDAMAARSRRVATWLRDQGVRAGDRMIVMLGNQPELWETALAAIAAARRRHPRHPAARPRRPAGPRRARPGPARRRPRRRQRQVRRRPRRLHPHRRRRGAGPGAPTRRRTAPTTGSSPTDPPAPTTRSCSTSPPGPPPAPNSWSTPTPRTPSATWPPCTGPASGPETSTSTSPRPAGPSTPGRTSSRPGTPRPPSSSTPTRASTPPASWPRWTGTASRASAPRPPSGACSSRPT